MAINRWWENEPAERYWMEITARDDLGSDLMAPQVDDAGVAYWSYNLVADVREGDIVLHWHKSLAEVPAIVGISVADGAPYESTIRWSSRGSYGRLRTSTDEEPSWMCDLRDYRPLASPVTQSSLRRAEPALRRVLADLRQRHSGPLYFPFAFSDKRPVRTAQGYLVKFPAALLDVVPELETVPRGFRSRTPSRPSRPPRARRAGRIADPALRKALERHAVAIATDYYIDAGYSVEDVGDVESYDLRATSAMEVRHVEVKGSSGRDIEDVELTHREVEHASLATTDLVVVDEIVWWREPDGTVATTSGRARVWRDWVPAPATLSPTRFRHALGAGGEEQ